MFQTRKISFITLFLKLIERKSFSGIMQRYIKLLELLEMGGIECLNIRGLN